MILEGENINTELKLASKSLPKNLFEIVCAFLNTIGGTIILGANDKREIIGIEKEYIDSLKKDFTSQCNNEEIISPTIFDELKEIDIDGHTSRVIIYKDKMIMENPNSFCTMGYLTVHNYIPVAKNPTLAKFFREIGYADEPGSGMKRITENTILYSGKPPIMEDKEMFRITIPLTRDRAYDEIELKELVEEEMNGNRNSVSYSEICSVNSDEKKVLELISINPSITAEEMSQKTNFSTRKIYRIYDKLKEENYIKRVGTRNKGSWIVMKKE